MKLTRRDISLKLIVLALFIAVIIAVGTAFPNGKLPIVAHTAQQGWTLPLVTISIEHPPLSARRRLPRLPR